jgi:hypothetical protein
MGRIVVLVLGEEDGVARVALGELVIGEAICG